MGYVTIASQLVTLLQTITDLQQVFAYEPDTLGVYPCATVTASGHEDQFRTIGAHGSNDRTFSFVIRLYYRLDANQDAETTLLDLADQVLAKLEANVTVSGVWDIAQPTAAVFRTGEREVPVQVCELTAAFRVFAAR